MTLFKDINQLAEDVETAAAAYDEAQEQASRARMRETEALNRLNKAQAAFDNAVAEAKKGSHNTSDWGRQK